MAYRVLPDGSQEWTLNGKWHRVDGPAFIKCDYEAWWRFGKRHREDGPAVVRQGDKEWWLNDNCYSFEKWLELLPISETEKLVLYMRWK